MGADFNNDKNPQPETAVKKKVKYKGKKVKYKVSIGDRIISVLTYVIYSLFAFVCANPFTIFFLTQSVPTN